MTKADLVEQVVHAIGRRVTKRECGLVVDAFLDALREALARGEGIELRGFGTFKVGHRRARTGSQPQDRRDGRGRGIRCAGLPAIEAPPQPGGPRLWGVGHGRAPGGHAHRPAWSRTGATTPAPAGALADAGSLCVPIGSQSRREHKGCLQDRGRGFAASRGPADALAAEGAIMALVQRRSRARHAADDPALAGLGRGLDPGGGTGGVRPGGRGDRRRCGGNADHAVAGHDADSPAIIDGLDRR